jgi:N utilization substance protein B
MSKGEKRSAARLAAVQALYQMDITGTPLPDVLTEFELHWIGREIEGVEMKEAEEEFFRDIVSGVVKHQVEIDRRIDETLAEGWPLARVEAVLRAGLRAGGYELLRRKDVPAKVVISEYVDVIRAFYEGEETGMANAVLDRMARHWREGELDARR